MGRIDYDLNRRLGTQRKRKRSQVGGTSWRACSNPGAAGQALAAAPSSQPKRKNDPRGGIVVGVFQCEVRKGFDVCGQFSGTKRPSPKAGGSWTSAVLHRPGTWMSPRLGHGCPKAEDAQHRADKWRRSDGHGCGAPCERVFRLKDSVFRELNVSNASASSSRFGHRVESAAK